VKINGAFYRSAVREIFGRMAVVEDRPPSATATAVKKLPGFYFLPRSEMLRLFASIRRGFHSISCRNQSHFAFAIFVPSLHRPRMSIRSRTPRRPRQFRARHSSIDFEHAAEPSMRPFHAMSVIRLCHVPRATAR